MAHKKFFLREEGDNHIEEALRLLRTNMHFIETRKKRVVLCTSTIPGEGKSFVVSNYALSVATSGEKVLLIDCDIRRPKAHEYFDLEVNYGISDVLLGERKVEDVILKDVEKNLDLLPAKISDNNITELFLGHRIKKLLESLKKKYDLIILDTPPLLATSDAAILSEHSNGVIFVCGYGMVSKKELIKAKKMLTQADVRLYGVVVNKIEEAGYSGGNLGYYSSSYKYYDDYMNRKS